MMAEANFTYTGCIVIVYRCMCDWSGWMSIVQVIGSYQPSIVPARMYMNKADVPYIGCNLTTLIRLDLGHLRVRILLDHMTQPSPNLIKDWPQRKRSWSLASDISATISLAWYLRAFNRVSQSTQARCLFSPVNTTSRAWRRQRLKVLMWRHTGRALESKLSIRPPLMELHQSTSSRLSSRWERVRGYWAGTSGLV